MSNFFDGPNPLSRCKRVPVGLLGKLAACGRCGYRCRSATDCVQDQSVGEQIRTNISSSITKLLSPDQGGNRKAVAPEVLQILNSRNASRFINRDRSDQDNSLRVLVADGDHDTTFTLALVIRHMGHKVITVNDGQKALEIVHLFKPHVALLELEMPRLGGVRVCREIGNYKLEPKPLLLALTSWGQDSDRAAARSAGFDHHILKPIEFETLDMLFANLQPQLN